MEIFEEVGTVITDFKFGMTKGLVREDSRERRMRDCNICCSACKHHRPELTWTLTPQH